VKCDTLFPKNSKPTRVDVNQSLLQRKVGIKERKSALVVEVRRHIKLFDVDERGLIRVRGLWVSCLKVSPFQLLEVLQQRKDPPRSAQIYARRKDLCPIYGIDLEIYARSMRDLCAPQGVFLIFNTVIDFSKAAAVPIMSIDLGAPGWVLRIYRQVDV